MSTPERQSGSEDTSVFTQAEALKALGKERAEARTAWTSQDKAVLRDNPEGESQATAAELRYRAAVVAETRNQVREMLAEGKSREEVQEFVAGRILDAQIERMQAEIDAKANPETKLGRAKGKFIEAWRKHKKARAAIGVGLVVASGGFAAAGLAPLAVGAMGVRASMSGIGGYMGAKAGQEAVGRHLERRKGKDKEALTLQEAAEMSSDERVKRMSALLSSGILEGKGPEDSQGDKATYDVLRQMERQDILKQLREHNETHRGRNIVYAAGLVTDHRQEQQHKAERERLKTDHHLNNKRRKWALGVGAATAGITILTHKNAGATVEHIQHIKPDLHSLVSPDQASDHLHRAVSNEWGSVGEVYNPKGIIMDKVNGHESMLDALQKHFENTQEFSTVPQENRMAMMQDVIKNKGIETVTRDGESYWRISSSVMQQAIENHQ